MPYELVTWCVVGVVGLAILVIIVSAIGDSISSKKRGGGSSNSFDFGDIFDDFD